MTKIEHQPLSDRAYLEIRQGLTNGAFSPRQPLVIRTLAQHYGISATPIREALQRLVAERLLEVLPNRSIVVPLMTRERFSRLLPIRGSLEGLAAELALPNISGSDIAHLDQLQTQMAQTTHSYDSQTYLKLNRAFHFSIYEKSDNPELLRLIQDMWLKVGPVFTGLFDDDYYRLHANDEHLQILAAIRSGNAAEVGRAMQQDLSLAAESLLAHMQGSTG